MSEIAGAIQVSVPQPSIAFQPTSSRETRFRAMVERTHKRNFRLGVANGVLTGLGAYFISRSTIIPSFFSHLTTSSALIGFVSQFELIGWYLPQLFAAAFVVHRAQKMSWYRVTASVRGISFLALAVITLVHPSPLTLLLLTIVAYTSFTMSDGMGGVVFFELLAKAIPANRRGRFLGLRISISALLSATLGATLVATLLASADYPRNFGYVFLVGAIIGGTGLMLFGAMREPRTVAPPPPRTVREQLREAFAILRSDNRYRRYVRMRLLIGSWTAGVPFLVLFAQRRLGFTTSEIGLFIAADCLGTIISNFFWERLADRHSTKSCLKWAASVSIVLPLVVLLYTVFPLPRLLYAIVFSLAAAVDSGTTIGGMNYILEISPENNRATYIGLFNSLLALPCFLAAAGGLLLDLAGYRVLYLVVLGLGVASLLATRPLERFSKAAA